VCSVNTLYFWPDVEKALAECRRVLAPDGRLVLTFTDRAVLESWPGHRHGFTLYDVADVERHLRGAGFEAPDVAEGTNPGGGRFFCVRARAPLGAAAGPRAAGLRPREAPGGPPRAAPPLSRRR
jgi:SAM-dependent methyltransferase